MIPTDILKPIIANRMVGCKSYQTEAKFVGYNSGPDVLIGALIHYQYKKDGKLGHFYEYVYFTNEKGKLWKAEKLGSLNKIEELITIPTPYILESFNILIEDKNKEDLWQVTPEIISESTAQLMYGNSLDIIEPIKFLIETPTKKGRKSAEIADNSEVVPSEPQSDNPNNQGNSSESTEEITNESPVTDSRSGEINAEPDEKQ